MIGAKAVRTAVAAVCLLTSCAAPVSAGPIPGTAGCRQEKSTFVEVVPDAKGYPNPEAAADALVATLGSRPRTGDWQPQKDGETPTSARLVAPPYLASVSRREDGTWIGGALSECVVPA